MDFIWKEKGNGIVNADILAQTFSGIVVSYGWKARKTDGRTVRVRILETDIPYPNPISSVSTFTHEPSLGKEAK